MPRSWFSIVATHPNEAELSIYDAIGCGGVSAKDFLAAISPLKGKHLTVRINSPGGSCFEGFAIANAMKRHQGGVTTHNDGVAASMASVIAIAGQPAQMAENAFLMIHNPSGGAAGSAEEIRRAADLIETVTDRLVAAYVARTGLPESEIREMMDNETWMDAQEALALNFIDNITEQDADFEAVARFDTSEGGIRKIPDRVLQRMKQPSKAAATISARGQAKAAVAAGATIAEQGEAVLWAIYRTLHPSEKTAFYRKWEHVLNRR